MPNLDPCGKLTLTVHDAKHHAFYYTTRPSIPGALEYFLPIASMILNNQTRINVTDQILPTANSIQSKHSYLNPQHFASAQYSALSSFFLANCQLPTANCQLFRFRSALSTSLPLSTQHSALSTQHFASAQHSALRFRSALSTQHSALFSLPTEFLNPQPMQVYQKHSQLAISR